MVKIISIIENYKKKVKAFNENKHKKNNSFKKENCEFNINEYLFNVSSLKRFGIQELRANLSLIALDNAKIKQR